MLLVIGGTVVNPEHIAYAQLETAKSGEQQIKVRMSTGHDLYFAGEAMKDFQAFVASVESEEANRQIRESRGKRTEQRVRELCALIGETIGTARAYGVSPDALRKIIEEQERTLILKIDNQTSAAVDDSSLSGASSSSSI